MQKTRKWKQLLVGIGILMLVIAVVGVFLKGTLIKRILLSEAMVSSDRMGKITTALSRPGDVESAYFENASIDQKQNILVWVSAFSLDQTRDPDRKRWATNFLNRIVRDESEPVACRLHAIASLSLWSQFRFIPWHEGIASKNVQLAEQCIRNVPRPPGVETLFLPIAIARVSPTSTRQLSPFEQDQLKLPLMKKLGSCFSLSDIGQKAMTTLGINEARDFGVEGQRYEREERYVEALICNVYAIHMKHFKHYGEGYALTVEELAGNHDRLARLLAQKSLEDVYRICVETATRYGLYPAVRDIGFYKDRARLAFDHEEWYRAAVWASAYLLCAPEDEEASELLSTSLDRFMSEGSSSIR